MELGDLCPTADSSQSDAGGSASGSWSASAESAFVTVCQTTARTRGATVDLANSYCECSLAKMEERYSEDEADTIYDSYASGGPLPSAYAEIGAACAEEVGLG
jgi:hypothetical protein